MKKLMFATALVASAAAFADGPTALNAISFEGYTAGYTFTNGTAENDESGNAQSGNGYFYYQGDQDGSSVKAFGSGDVAAPSSITRPAYFAGGAAGSNYLDLSTEGGTLWRSINAIEQGGTQEDPTWSLGTAQAVGADGIYLDTLVQFTPTEDGGDPGLESADKLAIWLNVDSNQQTNLMVRAAVIDLEGAPLAPTTFAITNKTVNAGEWYRLTVKAIPDIAGGEGVPGFQIKLDGQLLMSDTPTMTAGTISLLDGYTDYITDIRNGAVFASLGGINDNPTLQGVGFKGSGALDDIVWTTDDLFAAPSGGDTAWIDEVVNVFVGTNLSQAQKDAIATWASDNSITVTAGSEELAAAAYLLNLDELPEEIPELTITSIEEGESAWTLTVAASVDDTALALPATINGEVKLTQAATLAGLATATPTTVQMTIANGTGTVTVAKDAATAKFMKVGIGIATPAN